MRAWTDQGLLVTRRMYERRLDEMFDANVGGRVMIWCRNTGLVSTGKHGAYTDRPLRPFERAALILVTALITGTNLTLAQATALVSQRQDWIRHAISVSVTGEDLVLTHTVGRAMVVVEVTIPNAVLRDPVLGVSAALEMAA